MKKVLRVLSGLVGVLFLANLSGWIFDPASAADGLGMPLLDGVGRSTQIGDIGSFFLAVSGLSLVGALREKASLLCAAALLLGGAAMLRTFAWLAHGAAFTPGFIVAEVLTAGILLSTASQFSRAGSSD